MDMIGFRGKEGGRREGERGREREKKELWYTNEFTCAVTVNVSVADPSD